MFWNLTSLNVWCLVRYLLFSKRRNFRLVQIESNCRRQNKFDWKVEFVLGRVKNIVGKEENAGYQHFLLLPQFFSKSFLCRVVKSRDCVVKSESVTYNFRFRLRTIQLGIKLLQKSCRLIFDMYCPVYCGTCILWSEHAEIALSVSFSRLILSVFVY